MPQDALTASQFETIVNAIATELEGDWTADCNAYNVPQFHSARLTRAADNVSIMIRPKYGDDSRLHVIADWGEDACDRMCRIIDATVSATRAPAAIARDINRRVIDTFVPLLKAARDEFKVEQQRVTDGQALANTIGGFLNAATDRDLAHRGTKTHEHGYRVPEAEFNVRYQPEVTVSARFLNLTPEQGLSLAAWAQANITDAK